MKISVINVGLFCLCFLSNSYATSDEWSQRWKASSTRTNDNLVQANLIELKDSDYYSGLGKTTINSTSTSSIGTLSDIVSKNKMPEKILIGYKAYGELMNDRKFFEEVAGSAMEPSKRKYKKIKIKVTQDDYQLEVKCSS